MVDVAVGDAHVADAAVAGRLEVDAAVLRALHAEVGQRNVLNAALEPYAAARPAADADAVHEQVVHLHADDLRVDVALDVDLVADAGAEVHVVYADVGRALRGVAADLDAVALVGGVGVGDRAERQREVAQLDAV